MIDSRRNETIIIPVKEANRIALISLPAILLLTYMPFYIVWQENYFVIIWESISFLNVLLLIVIAVILHEGLHGVVWAVFAKKGFRSIKFGIKWEYLTPYCHCKQSLKMWQYVLGGIMPLLVLGIIPIFIAMYMGNALLLAIGVFFTWTAMGDVLSIWKLRKYQFYDLVYDHPDELGFIVQKDS